MKKKKIKLYTKILDLIVLFSFLIFFSFFILETPVIKSKLIFSLLTAALLGILFIIILWKLSKQQD